MNQINGELEKKIEEELISIEEKDDRKLYDVFTFLSDIKYDGKLSSKTVGQIINAIQHGLTRDYDMYRPYRSIFILIRELAPFHSEEIAAIQDDITEYLNGDIYDYDDFTAALYFFSGAWKDLESVWSSDNKASIIRNLIDIIEDEYESDESFDAFIADNVLRALIIFGKDDSKAQETIQWVEKVLEEEYQDDEEEDDE